jgi:hypothetical protein
VRRGAHEAADQHDEVAVEPIKDGKVVQPVEDGLSRRSALLLEGL